jgi:hypothetical protein
LADDEVIAGLDDISSLIPPEDMDPEMRLQVTIDTLTGHMRRGIPFGDEVDQIFQAETAMHAGDMEKFDKHLRLALKNIVDDEGIEAGMEWVRWLLSTLSVFENVPQDLKDEFSKVEDSYERGEHENAMAGLRLLKITAEGRLVGHWKELRKYTKGQYKRTKKNLDKESRSRVKRLISSADMMMYAGGLIYLRKGLRMIREAQEIIFPEAAILGMPLPSLH